MKQIEMTREVKEWLWSQFDRGRFDGLVFDGHRITEESISKQRGLWEQKRAIRARRHHFQRNTK